MGYKNQGHAGKSLVFSHVSRVTKIYSGSPSDPQALCSVGNNFMIYLIDSVSESFRGNTSEPLTESIMTMRSKPGSALIVKQSKMSFPSPLSKKQQESTGDEFEYRQDLISKKIKSVY